MYNYGIIENCVTHAYANLLTIRRQKQTGGASSNVNC